jgi:transcription elongation factor Elf1
MEIMKLTESIDLLERYAVCPECGNDKVGDGEGLLEISGNTFLRSCKCGWTIQIKQKEATHED